MAKEQTTTYANQRQAQESLRELNEAKSTADMQAALTQSKLQISVEENEGEAQATRAIQDAKRMVTMAEADPPTTWRVVTPLFACRWFACCNW